MTLCPTELKTHLLVQYKPTSCDIQAHKGDKIKVHYKVTGTYFHVQVKLFLFIFYARFTEWNFWSRGREPLQMELSLIQAMTGVIHLHFSLAAGKL